MTIIHNQFNNYFHLTTRVFLYRVTRGPRSRFIRRINKRIYHIGTRYYIKKIIQFNYNFYSICILNYVYLVVNRMIMFSYIQCGPYLRHAIKKEIITFIRRINIGRIFNVSYLFTELCSWFYNITQSIVSNGINSPVLYYLNNILGYHQYKMNNRINLNLSNSSKTQNLIKVNEKILEIQNRVNLYVTKNNLNFYPREIILQKLTNNKVVNFWQIDDKYYALERHHCRHIMQLLMPIPAATKDNIYKFKTTLIKSIGSNYVDLNDPRLDKEIAHLIRSTRGYGMTKVGTSSGKNTIILQSSFYVILGEYFVKSLTSRLLSHDLLNPTIFINLINNIQNYKTEFKLLDHLFLDFLLGYYRTEPFDTITIKDNIILIKTESNIISIDTAKFLLKDAVFWLNSNKILRIGLLIFNTFFHPSEYKIHDKNKIKFNLSEFCLVPLLYEKQKYSFDFLFKGNSSLGKTYEGKYIIDEKEQKDNIYSYSCHKFYPKHIQTILNIYEYRNRDNYYIFLFIKYYYNLEIDYNYIASIVNTTTLFISAQVFLSYMLDLDHEYLPAIQNLIKLNKEKRLNEIYGKKEAEKIKILINFYQEVQTKKYNIRSTLIYLNIYRNFHYFVNITIPKYTGREFSIFTPLDITIKAVRCLINTYTLPVKPLFVKNVSSNHFEFTNKNKLNLLDAYIVKRGEDTMKDYIKTNKEQIYHYLDSIVDMNKTIINKNYREFNLDNLLILTQNYRIDVYKATRYLIGKEALLNKEDFTVEKDASNSGLQILSLIFKSKSAAKLCGLLRAEFIQHGEITDLYAYVKNIFLDDINTLTQYLDNVTLGVPSPEKDIDEEFKYWLHINSKEVPLNDFIYIFMSNITHHLTILLDRSLWKAITMPQQYGISNYSIKEILMDKLKINHQLIFGTNQTLSSFCSLLVSWYQYRVKPRLPLIIKYLNVYKETHNKIKQQNKDIKIQNKDIKIYNKDIKKENQIIEKYNKSIRKSNKKNEKLITKNKNKIKSIIFKNNILSEFPLKEYKNEIPYIKKIKPIKFTSKTFKWNYQVFKLTEHKIKLGKQQIKFYRKLDEHNIPQIFRSLPPIFIHGLDATIVHKIKQKASQFQYNVTTIHDCFFVQSNYLSVLLQNLEDIYADLYNSNYFEDFINQNEFDPIHLNNIRKEGDEDYLDFDTMCRKHYHFVK